MTNNRIDHSNCDHDRTPAARAACRKARANEDTFQAALRRELIEVFNSANYIPSSNHWVFYAARRFANYTGDDLDIAAGAVLAYFRPTGDEAQDANRRRNGYTVTTDPRNMLRITLRAAS